MLAPFSSTFIDIDIRMLREFAQVKPVITSGVKAIPIIFWNSLFCDIILCWFGSVYSIAAVFFSRILRKPTIIILAGVDVAALPQINYGIWLSPWKSILLRYGLPQANKILVVTESMKEKIKFLARYDGANIEYLPFGFDTDFWDLGKEKEKIVLTVGHANSETRFKIKGIDYLFQAAEKLPEIQFQVIGVEKEFPETVGIQIPQNVSLLPVMPQEELRAYYQKSAVFCQPSRSEGLPNTLCEAMACGCIPVGTNVGGIPTAIGDTGHIVPPGDIDALAKALKEAISADSLQASKARERIIREFPLKRRIDGLKKAIEDIL